MVTLIKGQSNWQRNIYGVPACLNKNIDIWPQSIDKESQEDEIQNILVLIFCHNPTLT